MVLDFKAERDCKSNRLDGVTSASLSLVWRAPPGCPPGRLTPPAWHENVMDGWGARPLHWPSVLVITRASIYLLHKTTGSPTAGTFAQAHTGRQHKEELEHLCSDLKRTHVTWLTQNDNYSGLHRPSWKAKPWRCPSPLRHENSNCIPTRNCGMWLGFLLLFWTGGEEYSTCEDNFTVFMT